MYEQGNNVEISLVNKADNADQKLRNEEVNSIFRVLELKRK